ncbi:hypothetical protein J4G08_00710 [Candidatus Poribacteria bacterium]|nr:hypothetical protein [Candidatus Poribacteria bacterium]
MKVRDTMVYMFRHPMIPIGHLLCWCLFFVLLIVLIERSPDFFSSLKDALPIIAVLGFITSYREVRGKLKGIAKRQHVWMNWYNRQFATEMSERSLEALPLSDIPQIDSYFQKVKYLLVSMVRVPMPLLIHFTFWNFVFAAGIFLDDPMQISIMDGASSDQLFNEFLSEYLERLPIAAILTLITGSLEIKGYVNGTFKTQMEWTNWHNRYIKTDHEEGGTVEPPVLMTDQSVAIFTFRLPERVIFESVCWILAFTLCTTLLSWLGIVENPNFFVRYLSFAVILAL